MILESTIKISDRDYKWLEEHGGRNETDLFVEKDGRKYVFMNFKGIGEKKVYLPR